MEFMKRSGIYQGSNANVTFNPETCKAYSYGWWIFVARIKGKLVFNAYHYSNTTSKHQRKVRSLLRELGLRIDREVHCSRGLQNITTLTELNAAENETLAEQAAHRENLRLRGLERARARRAALKAAKAATASAPVLTLVPEAQ